ncbi:MAG TPA: hypothetical protein VHM90_16400 [Phycisphaerae bacterium]|jgi:hypothetical protein|nr:hypothetical protein [Phycisphaerae bacterium]
MGGTPFQFRFYALIPVILAASALVNADAVWNGQPYSLSLPHFSSVGQTAEASLVLPLAHDSACSVTVSVAQPGDEVLATGGHSLATSYKLTGAGLSNADAGYISSADFLTRIYVLPGNGPADSLTLWVRGAAPSAAAAEAGSYSANITLTVSW